jgi:hypothetical protein
MAYLGDASFMRHRVGQRVTQALGRANRQEGDWAMYLGLAPGFGTLLAQSGVQAAIPRDVKPTVDDSLARLGSGWPPIKAAAAAFWKACGISMATEEVAGDALRPRPGRTRAAATAGSATDEVTAVTRMWLGDLQKASRAASHAATKLLATGEVEHAAFWRYVEAQACYLEADASSTGKAIDALRAATDGGAATGWFVRLNRVLAELRGEQALRTDETPWSEWDEWLREAGPAGVQRAIERCRRGLGGTHDERAEALELLGRLAGVSAHRPSGQAVADAIWNWPSSRKIERRLWEVKAGTQRELPRDWVDQALGQLAQERTSQRIHVVGCIVSDAEAVSSSATSAARDLCLVQTDALSALFEMLSVRLLEYCDRWGGGSAIERGRSREQVEPLLPSGNWLAGLFSSSSGSLLTRNKVLHVFARN